MIGTQLYFSPSGSVLELFVLAPVEPFEATRLRQFQFHPEWPLWGFS